VWYYLTASPRARAGAMSSSLSVAKKQLRTLMKSKLADITQESVSLQSRSVFESLKTFSPYLNAERVSIFLSMPSGEIQTDAIVRHALSSGKQVFIPYLHKSPLGENDAPSRVMDMVRLRDLQDYESMQPDKWGIPSIDPTTIKDRQRILGGPDAHQSESTTLDMILMPGVAFDLDSETSQIRRLGHGRGFYDFFLQRYWAKTALLRSGQPHAVQLYGLALSEQFVSPHSGGPVPVGQYDKNLHGLVLGNGEIKTSSDSPDTSILHRR
ncbi:hypothetical protein BN1723_014614, partial [Verticillium longisporum]